MTTHVRYIMCSLKSKHIAKERLINMHCFSVFFAVFAAQYLFSYLG